MIILNVHILLLLLLILLRKEKYTINKNKTLLTIKILLCCGFKETKKMFINWQYFWCKKIFTTTYRWNTSGCYTIMLMFSTII